MKIKVSEATNLQLNWMVAKCEGLVIDVCDKYIRLTNTQDALKYGRWTFMPAEDWLQCGTIISHERIAFTDKSFLNDPQRGWLANLPNGKIIDSQYGSTHLIAAMRCYVVSKFGDEVEIPDVLQNDQSFLDHSPC